MRPQTSQNDISHYFEYSSQGIEVVQDGLQPMTFGEYLVDRRAISRAQLFDALKMQDENPGVRLGECLAANGSLRYSEIEKYLRTWNRLAVVEA